MNRAADALVIGAGISGAAVAYELRRTGYDVIWAAADDPDRPAATNAAGAMLGVFGEIQNAELTSRDRVDLGLRRRAIALYPEWLSALEEHSGLVVDKGAGTFIVGGARDPEAALIGGIAAQAEALGEPVEQVEIAAVPGLSPQRGHRPTDAIYLPTEGWVEAPDLCNALARACDNLGVRRVHERIHALRIENGRAVGAIAATGTSISAASTVVCAGSSTNEIAAAARLPRMIAAKGVSLLLRPAPGATPVEHVLRTPVREFACGVHLVPRRGGVFAGATNRASRFHGLTGRVTAGDVLYVLAGVTRELVSGLEEWDVADARFGYRPLSADGLPVVGATDVQGLSVATGAYRNGVLLAPLIASALRSEAFEDAPTDLNVMSPRHPLRTEGVPPPGELLARAVRDIAALSAEPGSHSWKARAAAIAEVLERGSSEGDAATARELLTLYPRPEMAPEALIELLEHSPGDG